MIPIRAKVRLEPNRAFRILLIVASATSLGAAILWLTRSWLPMLIWLLLSLALRLRFEFCGTRLPKIRQRIVTLVVFLLITGAAAIEGARRQIPDTHPATVAPEMLRHVILLQWPSILLWIVVAAGPEFLACLLYFPTQLHSAVHWISARESLVIPLHLEAEGRVQISLCFARPKRTQLRDAIQVQLQNVAGSVLEDLGVFRGDTKVTTSLGFSAGQYRLLIWNPVRSRAEVRFYVCLVQE